MSGLQRGILFGLLIEAFLVLFFFVLSQAFEAASRGALPQIHFARSE